MAKKTGTWLIAAGAAIMFVSLCFFPAAFENDQDRTILGAGLAVFAMGTLLVAGGLYAKASALAEQAGPVRVSAVAKRPRKSNCDRCGKNEAAIECRVHQLHLCIDCLREHYDFRSCAYIPSTRRAAGARAGA